MRINVYRDENLNANFQSPFVMPVGELILTDNISGLGNIKLRRSIFFFNLIMITSEIKITNKDMGFLEIMSSHRDIKIKNYYSRTINEIGCW